MALIQRDRILENLDHDHDAILPSEHVQEPESNKLLRLFAQAVGSFGFATSVLAICVIWFMPTLKPEQPTYHRRAVPPRVRRHSISGTTDIQSEITHKRSLTALITTSPPTQTAFPPPRHVRRVTFDVILSKPSRSHLAARRPPARITFISRDSADSVESVKKESGQEECETPDDPSPSSIVGPSIGVSSPASSSSCSSTSLSVCSGRSSITTLDTPPPDVLAGYPDIGCSKYDDRGVESDTSSRRRLSIPLHKRLPSVRKAFKRGGSKPPSSYGFPAPALSRTLSDATASDSEASFCPQRRSTLPFWPRTRKTSQTDSQGPAQIDLQAPEVAESATSPPCGNFVRRLSLQRNDKPNPPATPPSKESRRRSTPVPRTQPYGYPHFAPTPIPLSDIPDPEFPAYLKELTKQTRPGTADSLTKTSQRAQASLGVGRTRQPKLRDATL